jgi:hypothetical protein
MESKVCHFTVCGEGLTNIVRNMYCFEENREGALAILSSLDGIAEEQMIKVCTGDSRLNDMGDDGMIGYVEEPDMKFKHEYHMFMLNKELRARKILEGEEADRKRLEAAAEKNHIDVNVQKWVESKNPYHDENMLREKLSARGREMYEAGITVTTKDGPVFEKGRDIVFPQEPVIPEPSVETIRVGKWNVPKNLLDRYSLHVVKRIRASIRTGAIRVLDPMVVYSMEIERQSLHDAICKAVGFDHQADEPSEEQKEFDSAIGNYLDEHAGSILNGDE